MIRGEIMPRKSKVDKELVSETIVENNVDEIVTVNSSVVLADVKEFRMPLNEFIHINLLSDVKTVYICNIGGGDLYYIENSLDDKVLIKPNEIKKVDGVDKIILYSYSRPLVKIEQYK
jgi:hypothetical protein